MTTCAGTTSFSGMPRRKSRPGNPPGPGDAGLINGTPGRLFRGPGLAMQRGEPSRRWPPSIFFMPATPGARSPIFPASGRPVPTVLEIPTTLPTLDELLGLHGCRARRFQRPGPGPPETGAAPGAHHPRRTGGRTVPGGLWPACWQRCRRQGVAFFRLEDWARELVAGAGPDLPGGPGRFQAPARTGRHGLLPGRPGGPSS